MQPSSLLWAVAASAVSAASAPPSSSSSSAAPLSSPTPTSVPATAHGFDALSSIYRAAILATVAAFILLSVLSGRELWLLRYGRSSSASSSPVAASTSASASASALQAKQHGSYTTPKHHSYGGIATPLSTTAGATTLPSSAPSSSFRGGGDLSTGAEMRQRLFVLLFAAASVRAVALIVEICTLHLATTIPNSSLYARLRSLFLWLPSLLFVSTYGLVLLFWAQLCYACWGKFHPWPRRLFFAFNVLLYLVALIVVVATPTAGAFSRACDLALGGVYALGLVTLVYYSARLIQFFRTHGPDEEFFFDLPRAATSPPRASPRQIVLRRITIVCVLLTVLFTAKAAYLFGLSTGVTRGHSPMTVEFTVYLLTEFFPCALLLMVTRKKAVPPPPPETTTTAAPSLTPGGIPPVYGLRGRNNSGYYDDNQSVGSGSLTGYQFQSVQRTYGATLTNAVRSTPTMAAGGAYQGTENGASNPSYV